MCNLHTKERSKKMLERIVDDELSGTYLIFQEAITTSTELYVRIKEYQETKNNASLAKEIVQYRNDYPFMFRGNVYDMSYFWNHSELPLPEIRKLHSDLQHEVMKTFNDLARKKYVKFLPDRDCYVLTPRGKQQLYKSRFVLHSLQGDMEINRQIANGIQDELSARAENREEQLDKFTKMSKESNCYLDGDNGAYIKSERGENEKILYYFSDGTSTEKEISKEELFSVCEKSLSNPKAVKNHRPEIEINFNDNVLKTNNEIVREAGGKAIAKSAVTKSATMATGKIGMAVEIGRKILETLSFLAQTHTKIR